MRIRTSSTGETEIEGNITELRELRRRILDMLSNVGEPVSAEAEVAYDPTPYGMKLRRLVIRCVDEPARVKIQRDALEIVGSKSDLNAFCSFLHFDDDAASGCHSHYEYNDDHPFIAPDSLPLVISVGYR